MPPYRQRQTKKLLAQISGSEFNGKSTLAYGTSKNSRMD